MFLPELSKISAERETVSVFGGYNHNLRIGDGEFYDMKNLTSSYYPALASRKPRGKYKETDGKVVGMLDKNGLCLVTEKNGHLFFETPDSKKYDLGKIENANQTAIRTLTSMGAYVVIMPDKKYINVLKPDDCGNVERTYTSQSGKLTTFSLSAADGTEYSPDCISDKEPDTESLENGYFWLDTGQTPPSLKQWSKGSDSSGMWISVLTTYIKIGCDGIGKDFKERDGVTISGVTVEQLKDEINNTPLLIYACDEDYIVVVGMISSAAKLSQAAAITVACQMPDMDFLIESNNRLWGCRYGLNQSGEAVNELYACALGDFKNWNCFQGTSQDSYTVSLGTDGPFTGAISYLGNPIFFKENCLHIVYGNYPSEYQVQDTACRGVQNGSSRSLAMVNEVLYYKSRNGICAYNGALPTEVSSVLGEQAYTDAVACYHHGKYYISMKDTTTGKYNLFVFDKNKGLWHKEDDLQVIAFCPVDEEIYFLGTDDCCINSIFGTGTTESTPISWMAETGIIGNVSPDKRYVSRLNVKLSLEIGSNIVVSIQYDSSEVWETLHVVHGNRLNGFSLPLRPKRCDHFRLKFEGAGNVKIFSISKIIEKGSDL